MGRFGKLEALGTKSELSTRDRQLVFCARIKRYCCAEIFLDNSLLERLGYAIFPKRESHYDLYSSAPRSVAEKYPDVPPPDDPLSPHLLAARWVGHELYGEDMPSIAVELLERGLDTRSVRRLAGEMQIKNSADAEPLVAAMFRELGVAYPISRAAANLIASRQMARDVIAGRRNAWVAGSHLELRSGTGIRMCPNLQRFLQSTTR